MEKNAQDIFWILMSASLVLLMQGGFLAVESGLTRTKNSINVAIKNITDFGVATILYWSFGFGIMFGTSFSGIFGTNHFFYSYNGNNSWEPAFFLFQLVFCGTAATIVSGAVAERLKFQAYLFSTTIISGLIYPIVGHWAWGGALTGETTGWLGKLGFVDFAGSTVVHSVGGWIALAMLLIVGPRTGRFLPDGEVQTINPSNLPLAMLGGILLWFGWVGFNGGSTLAFTVKTASVIANTIIASGFGLFSALVVGWFLRKYPEGTLPLNGSLGGLVAITASAHAVTPPSAAVIGSIGGIVAVLSEELLLKLKIDDGVGAIPVHLFAGIWGTLAAGIFGKLDELGTDLSRFEQVLRQVYGIVSIGTFSFGCSYILFFIYNKISPLRVTLEEEKIGLNVSEHKSKTELIELFTVMDTQTKTGDISHDAPVEPFTEVGQIAERYNLVLKKIRATLQENEKARKEITKAYDKLFEEQQKAEKLLLNILPVSVATKLKQSGNVIAQSFSGVTILFADIVGFTKLASRYAPEKIVKILDRIFSEFDLLTEKYGLEKIKTIGDAYMVAGGLPIPRADHAQAVANMALEMQKVIKRFKFTDNEPVKIRIGINSGSVVAGIIGQKKFIYDIWGDAVNLASRLESTGIEGEIQISEKTKEILGEKYLIQKRGEIEIKGKGMITTYILFGKAS